MNPFIIPRFFCLSVKYFLEIFPSEVVTLNITKAMMTAITVSGMLSTIMLMKVATIVIRDWKSLGTLLPITCLSVSMSFVYTDIMSPWACESK